MSTTRAKDVATPRSYLSACSFHSVSTRARCPSLSLNSFLHFFFHHASQGPKGSRDPPRDPCMCACSFSLLFYILFRLITITITITLTPALFVVPGIPQVAWHEVRRATPRKALTLATLHAARGSTPTDWATCPRSTCVPPHHALFFVAEPASRLPSLLRGIIRRRRPRFALCAGGAGTGRLTRFSSEGLCKVHKARDGMG